MSGENEFTRLARHFKNLPDFLIGSQVIEYNIRDWDLYVDTIKTANECKTLAVFAFLANNQPMQTTCVEFYGKDWEEGLKHKFKLEIANVGLSEVDEIVTFWNGTKFTLKLKGTHASYMGELPFYFEPVNTLAKKELSLA